MKKYSILHIVNNLSFGGVQTHLARFVKQYPDPEGQNIVVTMGEDNPQEDLIRDRAEVLHLPVNGVRRAAKSSKRFRELTSLDYDLVHVWPTSPIYQGVSWFLQQLSPKKKPVVFGAYGLMGAPYYKGVDAKKRAKWLIKYGLFKGLMNTADIYLSNSSAVTKSLENFGYPSEKIRTITLGVDTKEFCPNQFSGESLRRELGVADNSVLIGTASRNDYNKDIPTILEGLSLLRSRARDEFNRASLVVCGKRTDSHDLAKMRDRLGIQDKVHLLGPRTDMPRIFNAMNVSTLCSHQEGFGLVVPESMACQTPAIVSNVGIMPEIVGDTGMVVEPGRPDQLAEAFACMLRKPDGEFRVLREHARKRVVKSYDCRRADAEQVQLYREMIGIN